MLFHALVIHKLFRAFSLLLRHTPDLIPLTSELYAILKKGKKNAGLFYPPMERSFLIFFNKISPLDNNWFDEDKHLGKLFCLLFLIKKSILFPFTFAWERGFDSDRQREKKEKERRKKLGSKKKWLRNVKAFTHSALTERTYTSLVYFLFLLLIIYVLLWRFKELLSLNVWHNVSRGLKGREENKFLQVHEGDVEAHPPFFPP